MRRRFAWQRSHRMTVEQECDRLLEEYSRDFERISNVLDRHFETIHDRAQLLLSICGVLISASVLVTTGRFIGGRIKFAGHQVTGLLLVMAGILDIAAAAIVVGWVLRIRWITRHPGEDVRSWLLSNLAYRDSKARAYRLSTVLVLLSMASYQCAIAIALSSL